MASPPLSISLFPGVVTDLRAKPQIRIPGIPPSASSAAAGILVRPKMKENARERVHLDLGVVIKHFRYSMESNDVVEKL